MPGVLGGCACGNAASAIVDQRPFAFSLAHRSIFIVNDCGRVGGPRERKLGRENDRAELGHKNSPQSGVNQTPA